MAAPRVRWRIAILAVVVVAVTSLCAVPTGTRYALGAPAPSASVTPAGPAGTTVSLSATDFPLADVGHSAAIAFDGVTIDSQPLHLCTARAGVAAGAGLGVDCDGGTVSETVPAAAQPGAYTFTVRVGGDEAQAAFTVTAAPMTPSATPSQTTTVAPSPSASTTTTATPTATATAGRSPTAAPAAANTATATAVPVHFPTERAGGGTTATATATRAALRRPQPAAGPQLLYTVPAGAFPPLHGVGDRRFGVVEAFEVPQRADDLHLGWERVQIRWDELQPRGPLQWDANATANDRPFDAEIAHGHQLVGVLQGVPAWAAQNPKDGNAAVPKGLDLPWNDPHNYWGQFVFRAARHYAGRIDTLVVLNEVNIGTGPYRQFDGSVAQYAQMLRVAYLAAHAANPHVAVHIYGDSVYADQGAWFDKTLDALARFPDAQANGLFFDAAEVHLYDSVLGWDHLIARWRQIMRDHGVDKPIWMSETNVAPRDDRVAPAFPANHNTLLANQPDFLVDAFAAGLGLGLPRIEVYRMLDPQHIYPEHPNGLVRRNGTVRPEYAAVKTLTTWLAGVDAARYEPCTTPYVDKSCLFRVVLERPGQEIQVLWNQGGRALDATVPAVSARATVVRPLGQTQTVRAKNGRFTFALPGATDRAVLPTTHNGVITSMSQLRFTDELKIGSTPLIVVQNLPAGRHVAGLHALPTETDRSAGATLGALPSVALAPDGSGVHALADPAHDRVLVEDAAGRITARIGGTGGAPGQFRGPAGVAIGPDGTLYVADMGNARIEEFDLSGRLLGGFGRYDAGVASLHAPSAVAVAPDGTLYVVDAAQDAVLHFSRMGAFLGRFAGPGYGVGQLDGPGGLAVDAQGHVWVADTLNNRVLEFDGLGRQLAQIGTGAAAGGASNLHWPTGVTVLSGGGIAIADADNGRVVVVAHPQTYLSGVSVAGLRQPGGLAVAPDGSYFVADTAADRIVHLDAAGHQLGTFGTRGFGQGQFFGPLGLAFGPDGNLYVADGGNNRIEVLTPGGRFVRSIGRQGHALGQFVGPHAVSVAPDGTLWVADTFNARIQHLTPGGGVLGTIKGVNGAWGVASDGQGGVYYSAYWGQRIYHWTPHGLQGWGGPGSGAGEFDHPSALAYTAGSGTLYAVDEGNARVQYVKDGRIAGQRGGAGPDASGLGRPVAVAVAPDNTIAVLDAVHKRIVCYAGSAVAGFRSIAATGVPLALASDRSGALVILAAGQWSGFGATGTIPAVG